MLSEQIKWLKAHASSFSAGRNILQALQVLKEIRIEI